MTRLAAALVAVLLIAAAPAQAAADVAASLLVEVNAARVKNGLRPVRLEPRLSRVARAHSAAMAQRRFFDHRGPDGKRVGERVVAVDYGFLFVGENLSAGMEDPASVVRQWMLSDGHRRNLLEARATEAGIGYVAAPQGEYLHYWTLILAEPAKP